MKSPSVIVICLALSFFLVPSVSAQNRSKLQAQFDTWTKNDLWSEAKARGISAKTFDQALNGLELHLKLPDLVMPGAKPKKKRTQSQAEFRSPAAYFSENNLKSQAKTGRTLFRKWSKTLKQIEKRYGVPGRFLIAIWGRESAFGRAKIPYSAIQVLATKAFMSTRKDLFREELLSALIIIQRDHLNKNTLKGSWAGALGQPQFMPSSFLKYAVDFDGDGKKDIWNSVPDTLASMANYLSQNGWSSRNDWGFEVRIPAALSCAMEGPDRARKIGEWENDGIRRTTGKPFPDARALNKTMMLVPAGRQGPHFIVTENFYVIKKYNNSDLYALFVGNLADRIEFGAARFNTNWQEQPKMLRSQIARMQRKLQKLGYDVGGADGLPGFRTRRSIGEWQIGEGRKSTCFPDLELIGELK